MRIKAPVLKADNKIFYDNKQPVLMRDKTKKLEFPPTTKKNVPQWNHLSGQFNDMNVKLNEMKHKPFMTKWKRVPNIDGIGARGRWNHTKEHLKEPTYKLNKIKHHKEKDVEIKFAEFETQKTRDEDGAEVRGKVVLNHQEGVEELRKVMKKVPKGALQKKGLFGSGWAYNIYEESITPDDDGFLKNSNIYDDEFVDLTESIVEDKTKNAKTQIRPNPAGI